MKKLLSLCVAVLLLGACSSDDDKSSSAVNLDQLAKRWYPVSSKIGNNTIPYDGHLSCGKDYLEFTANSTVVRDVDYVDCQTDAVVSSGVYSVTNNTLTTTINNETIVYDVKRLNSSALQMEATFNGTKILYIFTSTP